MSFSSFMVDVCCAPCWLKWNIDRPCKLRNSIKELVGHVGWVETGERRNGFLVTREIMEVRACRYSCLHASIDQKGKRYRDTLPAMNWWMVTYQFCPELSTKKDLKDKDMRRRRNGCKDSILSYDYWDRGSDESRLANEYSEATSLIWCRQSSIY